MTETARATNNHTDREIRIGVSSCLLGERVRFDANHKRDLFLTEGLGRYVRFVPVCPEVDIGLGVPRETIRLAKEGGRLRLVAPSSGADHTDAMQRYAAEKAEWLAAQELSGYVFKKDSPSCGMERVRVYDGNGMAERSGRGMFAEALMGRLPNLPVEEEGRLHDPALRESFVERVFAYTRLRDLFLSAWTVGDLVDHHTREKLVLLAHDPKRYEALGRLVAEARQLPREEVAERYERETMTALSVHAGRGGHTNVLQHMAGFLKKLLSSDARQDVDRTILDYRRGLLPLVVPLSLVRHYVRVHGVAYLLSQRYLDPHPAELMLRNSL